MEYIRLFFLDIKPKHSLGCRVDCSILIVSNFTFLTKLRLGIEREESKK